MSKKQKKKITIKIVPGEAVFVATAEVLEHISATYLRIAAESKSFEEANSWKNTAESINNWIKKTYYSGEENYEEEW
jgi:hypothetical protein